MADKENVPWYKKQMKTPWIGIIVFAFLLFAIFSGGGDEKNAKEKEKKTEEKQVVEYRIAEESTRAKKVTLRITTEAATEKEFKEIAEELYEDYEMKWVKGEINSIHIWAHEPSEEKSFGEHKATVKVAYDNQGRASTGVEKGSKFSIELD